MDERFFFGGHGGLRVGTIWGGGDTIRGLEAGWREGEWMGSIYWSLAGAWLWVVGWGYPSLGRWGVLGDGWE